MNEKTENILNTGIGISGVAGAGALGTGLYQHSKLNKPIEETILTGEKARPFAMPDGRILVHAPYSPNHGSGEFVVLKRFIKGLRENGIKNPIDVYNSVVDAKQIPGIVPEDTILKNVKGEIPKFKEKNVDVIKRKDLKRGDRSYIAEFNAGEGLSHIGESPIRKNRYAGFFDNMKNTVSISKGTDFSINFDKSTPKGNVLPFVNPGDTTPDKKFLTSFIRRNNRNVDLRGKKIITVVAGGTGVFLDEIIPQVANAVKGRNDVHVLIMPGNASMVKGDIKRIAKSVLGDKVTVTGKLPPKDFIKASYSSDLHIGYPGSSSITEQLAFKNPSVLAVPASSGVKNAKTSVNNAAWAHSKWGIPTVNAGDPQGFSDTVNKLLNNSDQAYRAAEKRSAQAFKAYDKVNKKFINKIKRAMTHVPVFDTLKTGKYVDPSSSRFYLPKKLKAAGIAGLGTAGVLYLIKRLSSGNKKNKLNKVAFLSGYMEKNAKNVLLVHGWNRGPEVFRPLIKELKAAGHNPITLSYPSTKLSANEIANEYLKPFLKKHKGDVVVHSTGGLLTRMAGQGNDLLKNRRVVMVAPAIGGSFLANLRRLLNKIPFLGKRLDPLLHDLSVGSHTVSRTYDPLHGDIGVIAGTKGDGKLHTLLKALGGKNDGVVNLNRAKLPEAKVTKEVPYAHTAMLSEPSVLSDIRGFIEKGSFNK